MSDIIVCDGGCGARSPDPKTKLYEANRWIKVRVWENMDTAGANFRHGDRIFCRSCWPRVEAALRPTVGAPHV